MPALLSDGLPATIQKIIDTFSNINLFDAGVKILKSLWDGMLSLVDQMVSSISSKLSSMMPKLPSWLGGGKTEEVQARASGGTYGRGPLLVGERGPELSYATQGGFIAHYGQLAELARLSDRIRQGAVSAALAASVATASPALAASAPVAVSPSPLAMEASGNSSSAPTGTGGVHIELNYAPTITVGSGSSLSEDDFEAMLEEHADVLVDLIKRKLDEDGRLEF